MKSANSNQNGSILLIFLITLPFLIMVALAYTRLSLTSFQVGRSDQFHTAAQLAADAGADYAIQQISTNNAWAGTTGESLLQNDGKMRTTYAVSVTGNDTAKTLAVTGKTYFPATATTPSRSVSIVIDLRPVNSGNYSVISGAGGLFMSNSSKIVGGDVFINGEVKLSNSAQIGLSIKSVTLNVAHQICPNPPDTTYPRVCNSGENGQPISLTNDAHIYATVKANNQTNVNNISNPGLVPGSVTPQPLPTYDRSSQKAAVVNYLTGAAASCSGNTVKVWAANTKITGNVNLSNQCKVTVEGNVWITGNLTISNTSALIVTDLLGTSRPYIMVDGSAGARFSNGAELTPNVSGAGFEIITFYSSASCSPDCTSVTGPDLANSRSITTIDMANSASAPSSIFYAYWTQVQISNSGQIGALIGQTIKLSNSSTVTFGTAASTTDRVWVVNGYRRQ